MSFRYPGEIVSIATTERGDLELAIAREDSYEEFRVIMSLGDLMNLGAACCEAASTRVSQALTRLEVRQEVDPL